MPVDSFKITSVKDSLILDEANNPQDVYRVHFVWGRGRKGFVDIPKAQAPTTEMLMEIAQERIDDEIEKQDALWGFGAG